MYVKFEESNALVKNVIKIDSLGEDIEKILLKDSLVQEDEDKPKDNTNCEVQDVEVEPLNHFQRIGDMLQAIPRSSS